MSNKKRKNATASNDIDATNQSRESSMRETLNDFAYFQELWDKSIAQPTTTKKRKSNKQNNTMMDVDADDDISTTSSLQSSHFSASSDGSSIQLKKKRRKANMSKHDDTSITNTNDIHNKKEEDTKTSKCNTKQSKKRKVRRTHGQHVNSYQTLYHNMSIAQVDQLVGWAHSLSDNTNNHNCNIDNVSERERGIVELTHTSTAAAPPPPSHIAYLQHQISNRLKTGNSAATEDISDERRDRRSEDINIRVRDVDTSTYSTISKHNHNNMDTSTYIAIGMAIEERLTKSLMPLARAHVERCRRLELERDTSSVSGGIDLGSNRMNTNELTHQKRRLASDPFHAWTLPAAEAVAELARHGYATSNAVSELLGVSQSKEKRSTSSKDSSSSESSTSSSSDDS